MGTNTRCVLVAIIATVYVALVLGCSGSSSGIVTREWTEDVLLDGGKTIQVQRTVSFKETNALGGGAYNAIEQNATIAFTGELAQLPTWQQPLMALVLYHDDSANQWVLVATTTYCDLWTKRGKPKPPYWEYRLSDSGWHETPLSPASLGRPANLLHRYQAKLPSDHITVTERRRIESDGMVRTYREVWPDPDQYVCGEGDSRRR